MIQFRVQLSATDIQSVYKEVLLCRNMFLSIHAGKILKEQTEQNGIEECYLI